MLRGGLTPKHVDVAGLLEMLDFRPLPAPYLRPEVVAPGVAVFRPDVPDFVLTVVAPDAAGASGVDVAIPAAGPRSRSPPPARYESDLRRCNRARRCS